ncbi:hypothetical protein [Streptomyces sp. NPDC088847]|uniref:hypothetical protein n=1 Tax=Streptomyces sp. NPDC088847 TaxID=3365909 RepID=UPI003817CDC4
MSELERFVNGLPELQRHAFEDEILRRVQEDRKWRKVHDKFPERMPAMMTYANNAFERELRRQAAASTEPERRERRSSNPGPTRVTATEAMNNARDAITAHDAEQFAAYRARWEREAPRQRSVEPKESDFSHSGENAMIDSFAFEEAARVTREWREGEKERSTANLRNPGQDPLSDAVALNAVGDAAVARGTVGSEGLSPLSAADPFEEAERVRREWEKERSTAKSRDPGRDPSSDPVQEAEDARRVWAGEIEPLIDKEGRQLLGEQPSVKGRGGRTSPSSSTHTPVSQNHTRSNTPAPRGR